MGYYMAHQTPAKTDLADMKQQLANIVNIDIAGKELSSEEIVAIMNIDRINS